MKYMGSKARFAKDILPLILSDRKENQWYVEPFCGGMNVIDKVTGNRLANDSNIYLIEMWKLLLAGWNPPNYTREQYINIRDNKHNYPIGEVGWVGFNCSYSGKWFAGYAGLTKTKEGYRDYQKEALKNTLKQVKNLQGICISSKNYSELEIPDNSIVYCDPPYNGTTDYFNSFDSNVFWQWCRELKLNGHSVFVSEYEAPNDFTCIWSKKATSSLSANGLYGANKISVERLYTL